MNASVRQLNILWLWPDILNLHGDRGNAMALVHVCGLYGIDARITRVNRLTDDLDFEDADIILLGAGELAVMPAIAGALSGNITALKACIDNGGVIFATGTTGAALGVHTKRLDGSHIFGVGLVDMECTERREILGDDLIFRVCMDPADTACISGDAGSSGEGGGAADEVAMDVYGIQINMMDIALAAGQKPFGEVVYGWGNNGGAAEGAASGNIVFTNALGPVLVKNPWLTLDLINRSLSRRHGGVPLRFDPDLFKLELASAEAIRIFNEKKEKPRVEAIRIFNEKKEKP